jgi:hypothetical protein
MSSLTCEFAVDSDCVAPPLRIVLEFALKILPSEEVAWYIFLYRRGKPCFVLYCSFVYCFIFMLYVLYRRGKPYVVCFV